MIRSLISKYNKNLNIYKCLISSNITVGYTTVKHFSTGESRKSIEKAKFLETFQRIVNKDLAPNDTSQELKDAYQWFAKVLNYNIPKGKLNRGLSVIDSYVILKSAKNQQINDAELERIRILGWGPELIQGFMLVLDDIMDNSLTRRSQMCWYRMSDVGMMAINDGLFIEQCAFQLLRNHFRDSLYYQDLVDLTSQTILLTIYGQCLDMLSSPTEKKVNIKSFTKEQHSLIIKYKTAYYSFIFPVRLAMFASGVSDTIAHDTAEKILLKIGHYFQVQDDFLDCFASPEEIGKIGTDIENGKCSWPIVVALSLANQSQMKVLEDNYGIDDQNCVEKIKKIYNDLRIEDIYKKFEENIYSEICDDIKKCANDVHLPEEMFYAFLNKIYKRKK